MSEPTLQEPMPSASPSLERTFLGVLTELADRGQLSCVEIKNEISRRLGLDVDKINSLLSALEGWGFVDNVRHTVSERFVSFHVTKTAQLAAQRLHTGAQTVRDRIAAFRARLRTWSWFLLIGVSLLGLLFLLALVNQTFEFLRNIGVLTR